MFFFIADLFFQIDFQGVLFFLFIFFSYFFIQCISLYTNTMFLFLPV